MLAILVLRVGTFMDETVGMDHRLVAPPFPDGRLDGGDPVELAWNNSVVTFNAARISQTQQDHLLACHSSHVALAHITSESASMSDPAVAAGGPVVAAGQARRDNATTPRDSKGWDGKLRVDRKAVVQYPDDKTDDEESDEERLPRQEIEADEGRITTNRSGGQSWLEAGLTVTHQTCLTTIPWIPRSVVSALRRVCRESTGVLKSLVRKSISSIAAYLQSLLCALSGSPKLR